MSDAPSMQLVLVLPFIARCNHLQKTLSVQKKSTRLALKQYAVFSENWPTRNSNVAQEYVNKPFKSLKSEFNEPSRLLSLKPSGSWAMLASRNGCSNTHTCT